MQQPIETLQVATTKVTCDGDANSAHPRVFLKINADGFVDCPYCGKHYVLDKNALTPDAH